MPRSSSGRKPSPSRPRAGTGLVMAVLGFALVFPVVAALTGVNAATVSAVLAALPGLIIAVYGRHGSDEDSA